MFCPGCGSHCEDNSPFCPKCGKNLGTAGADSVVVETNAEGAVVNTQVAPKNESKTVLILGIVSLAINGTLGCICGCLGGLPGIVCAIVGLVMGFKEKGNYAPGQKNKNTEIGIILCIVSLALVVLFAIINAIIGGVAGYMSSFDSYY